MENDIKTLNQNSITILAKAAEGYLKDQDELTRSFVGPQLQAALQNLSALVEALPGKTNEAVTTGNEGAEQPSGKKSKK